MDSQGRTIWIAGARREDGKRFVVQADDCFFGFGKGCLYLAVERTMLGIIAAMAAKRYVVSADEKLTAFVELEAAVRSGREPRALRSA